jgi:hypothetical protein
VRLLLDEQISDKIANRLRDLGHDVVAATAEETMRGLGDADLFEVTQQEGRALVTYDRGDFEPVIRDYATTNRLHHGVVIVHINRFPGSHFARLTAALAALLERPDPGPSFVIWLPE